VYELSHAIIRNAKYKMGNLQSTSRHNERQNKSYGNKDIDQDKSHLNYHLKKPQENSYEREFYRLKEENQLKGNLRLTGKKQSNVACEFLVTSDTTFFDKLGNEGVKKFFETAYDFASKKCGEKNIISAVVHMDETTPHMHLTYIPTVKEVKKDLEIERVNCSKFWKGFNSYGQLQDEFHTFVTEKGFNLERGQKALSPEEKNKHLSVHEFKKVTLGNELNILQKDLESRKKNLKEVQAIEVPLEEINSLQGKYKPVNRLFRKNVVEVDVKDFERLQIVAKKYYVRENKELSFEKENSNLKSENSKLKQRVRILENETEGMEHKYAGLINKVKEENFSLRRENIKFKKHNENAESEISILHKVLDQSGQLENVQKIIKQLQQKELQKQKYLEFEQE